MLLVKEINSSLEKYD